MYKQVSDLGCTVDESPYNPFERDALKFKVVVIASHVFESAAACIDAVLCEKVPLT